MAAAVETAACKVASSVAGAVAVAVAAATPSRWTSRTEGHPGRPVTSRGCALGASMRRRAVRGRETVFLEGVNTVFH